MNSTTEIYNRVKNSKSSSVAACADTFAFFATLAQQSEALAANLGTVAEHARTTASHARDLGQTATEIERKMPRLDLSKPL